MGEISSVNDIANGVKSMIEDANDNPWVERMIRLGYATRGLLYGMVGFLAVQLIITGTGRLTGRSGVLATIASQPFGEILLIVIAIGLSGLAIWGVIRAVADPYHQGNDFEGLASRTGYFITGISYSALLISTVNLVTGPDTQQGSTSQTAEQATAGILTQPWGPWLVGGIGLVIIGVGFYQMYRGWSAAFTHKFDFFKMDTNQREWAVRMGRIGIMAMGVVLIIIGILAVLAAVQLNPQEVGGIDAALTFLLRQPFGPWLLGAVALGVIAYAAYSIMGALWFKIKGIS